MQTLLTADIISVFFLVILGIGIIHKKTVRTFSAKVLSYVCLALIISCIFDGACTLVYGPSVPYWLILLVWILTYSSGGVALLLFVWYCYVFISEKTYINKWLFYVPIILVIVDIFYNIIFVLSGKNIQIENGYITKVNNLPWVSIFLLISVMAYLPIISLTQHKKIGKRSIFVLGTFGIFPIMTSIWAYFFGGVNYTFAAGSISFTFVCVLLENRLAAENEAEQKQILIEKNKNLEDYQHRLEESLEEHESQVEEITVLNANLEERYNIIQSMSSIYFASYYIDLINDSYIELTSLGSIRETIKSSGRAQSSLYLACEKLILPQFTDRMKEFFDLSTIQERLKNKNSVSCEYIGVTSGWSMAFLIAGDRDSDGNLLHIFYSCRTIHDEKALEKKHKKELEDYNNIIATAGLGIWYIYLKDGVKPRMKANQKMLQLLGIKRKDLSEEDVYSWWSDRIDIGAMPSVLKSVETMKKGKFSENTYIWKHPKLGNIYVRCGGTGIQQEDGTTVLSGYHADVTSIVKEDERNKEELALARSLAESANAAKTAFLFNMSHDIRTPMNAIIGFTNLLEKYQDDKERRSDYLKKIQDSSNVLLAIINNVLEMSRIEKGAINIEESGWDVEQFNNSIYSIFSEMMKIKGIEYINECNIQHHYVICDSTKLREVFINIISNAYKYTNAGGKVISKLEELPNEKEGWVTFRTTISDTGIGMSEDFLPHIFEEFAREKNTTDNKIEGTGLGMSIVKNLVELMDGTIEVTSKLGEGSTFVITIPHKIADKASIIEYEENEIDYADFKEKRILLVEDNELNAEIAMEILSDAGFVIDHAVDGEESIQKIVDHEENYYELVLMDIQMPKMNGYEATKKIRELENSAKSKIKIIAMTANAFEEDKLNAKLVGMDGHIAKPINVKDLFRTISNVMKSEEEY